jgi:hypothetical protein
MAIERGAIEDVKVFVEKETSFVADRVIGSHSEIFIQLARLLKDSPQSLKKLSDNLICRAHSSEDLNAVLIATPLTLWTDLSERAISNIRKIWRFDGVADGGFGNLQRRVGSAVRRLSASTEASDALNISGENAKRAKAAKDLVSRILSPHPGGNGESWSVLKTKLDRVCSEISRVDNGAIGDHQALNNDFLNQVRQIEAFQNLGENWRNFVIESCTGLNWSRGAAVEHLGARIKLINDCVEVQRCASELLGKFSNFSVSLSEPGTYLFYNGFHICVSEKDGPRFWLNVTNSSDVSQSRRREDNSALSSGLVAIPVVGSDNYNIYLKPHRFYCEQPDENPEELMLFIGGAVKHPRESLDTVLGISKN